MEIAISSFYLFLGATSLFYLFIFAWYQVLDEGKKKSKVYWKKIDSRLSYAGALLLFLSASTFFLAAMKIEINFEESMLKGAVGDIKIASLIIKKEYCNKKPLIEPEICSVLDFIEIAMATNINPESPFLNKKAVIKDEISILDFQRLERALKYYNHRRKTSQNIPHIENNYLWPFFLIIVTTFANILAAFRIAKSHAEHTIEKKACAEKEVNNENKMDKSNSYEINMFKEIYNLKDNVINVFLEKKILLHEVVMRRQYITIPPHFQPWFTRRLELLEMNK